ncbi:MAG: cytochrome-c oxidase, cbb3-type subunit III [Oleispira antarctica]|uniref:Cbb3-type cytochrome c oxidase subunit n=1 Tax=Oleispira antarctica RB-8 TaxID=698738 RepID=R4YRC4_OLEAN|nr:cytochrome-c oxidase, cbb3-type subunit III [Oleispira antarctica]MBQ0793846.1 cytochrome-c oxidase, cbb3-type subunit III [Oleispira antarctica]CCK75823.1 Cytochrome c oxidase, cbb3-type, subunit III [Oleispira antarctica RB-8]|tara:strand:- start:2761 stop:3699 length:939 start_codon:yes stop_codon:yes gene_type:complete
MSVLSTFWSVWVIAIVFGTLIACGLLIQFSSKTQVHSEETDETTGHEYDGIKEFDNPLPRWWVMMFWATIIFAVGYIAAYGLANMQGFLKVEVNGEQVPWTQTAQWQNEVEQFDAKIAPLYAEYAATPIVELIKNEEALKTGQRIFASNCSVCHGSGAKGSQGFPNLTDNDWLYGGTPEDIVKTLTYGRQAMMPAKGLMPTMTETQIDQTVQYVRSLSGLKHDATLAEAGAGVFAQACTACHGADAKGMHITGAPNLTDNVWLYGGSTKQIEFTIRHGRNGKMPAQGDRFSEEQIHVLAAYVYSLSNKESAE